MASAIHADVDWCIVGNIHIMYHASLSIDVSIQYHEDTLFGAVGEYAVWTGTTPASFNINSDMVAANTAEILFNKQQVMNGYSWSKQQPPKCKKMITPAPGLFDKNVRINSFNASIPESTMLIANEPVQISLSLGLKECKPI